MYTFFLDIDETYNFLEKQNDGTYKMLEHFQDHEYLEREYDLFAEGARGSEYIYEFTIDLKNRLIPIGIYKENGQCRVQMEDVQIGKLFFCFFFKEHPDEYGFLYVPKNPDDDDDIIVKVINWDIKKEGEFFKGYLTLKFSMLNKFLEKVKKITSSEILEKEFHFEKFNYVDKNGKEKTALLEVSSNTNLLLDFLKQ